MPTRTSISLQDDGPPLLLIEVLSEPTYEADLDLARGKGYSYAHAGVREYLTIDPMGTYLPEGVRAWRLEQGIYRPWQPESEGRWNTREIPIAIGLEGLLATLYTRTGRRMLHEGEVEETLARERRLHARDREESERLRRLLDEQQQR